MTKKNIFLIALVVALAGLYAYYFTDWFVTKNIQITYTLRPEPVPRKRKSAPVPPERANTVIFGFDQKYEFTSIKVIPVREIETNKFPHPVWFLVSDSNSVPMKSFTYGSTIKGMRPNIPEAEADPLDPDVTYRLFVEAGPIKGEYDFQTTRKEPAGN